MVFPPQISISMILKWYRDDFGSTNHAVGGSSIYMYMYMYYITLHNYIVHITKYTMASHLLHYGFGMFLLTLGVVDGMTQGTVNCVSVCILSARNVQCVISHAITIIHQFLHVQSDIPLPSSPLPLPPPLPSLPLSPPHSLSSLPLPLPPPPSPSLPSPCPQQMLQWVCSHMADSDKKTALTTLLDQHNYKLRFQRYNWDLNAN